MAERWTEKGDLFEVDHAVATQFMFLQVKFNASPRDTLSMLILAGDDMTEVQRLRLRHRLADLKADHQAMLKGQVRPRSSPDDSWLPL